MKNKRRLSTFIGQNFDTIERQHFKIFLNAGEIYYDKQTGINIRTARKIIFHEIPKSALPDCLVLLDRDGLIQRKNDYEKDLDLLTNEIRQICIQNKTCDDHLHRISVEEFDNQMAKILIQTTDGTCRDTFRTRHLCVIL